jgi:hypothetical protein
METNPYRPAEEALVGHDVVVDGRFEAARERGRALMAAWAEEDQAELAEVIDLRSRSDRQAMA